MIENDHVYTGKVYQKLRACKNTIVTILIRLTVFHVQSSKEGRERKILLSMSREEYGTNFGIKKQSGPVRIQLPEGCSCSALNQSHGTYVLLKETKTKKIRHLDLDENSMVLEEAMVNRLNISLEVLLGNCVELEIFSVPAKRRHL